MSADGDLALAFETDEAVEDGSPAERFDGPLDGITPRFVAKIGDERFGVEDDR